MNFKRRRYLTNDDQKGHDATNVQQNHDPLSSFGNRKNIKAGGVWGYSADSYLELNNLCKRHRKLQDISHEHTWHPKLKTNWFLHKM